MIARLGATGSGKLSGAGLAIIFYGRGIEYQGQNNNVRAIADYSEAIRLDPSKDGAYYNRGSIYVGQKDYTRAIANYTEVIRINPQAAAAFRYRGQARRLLGKVTEGDADIAQACNLDPAYCENETQ